MWHTFAVNIALQTDWQCTRLWPWKFYMKKVNLSKDSKQVDNKTQNSPPKNATLPQINWWQEVYFYSLCDTKRTEKTGQILNDIRRSQNVRESPSCVNLYPAGVKAKGKSVPLQAWSGLEVSRKLMFPYFMTTAQEVGRVVKLTHRPNLPPGNPPGTDFC